LCVVCARLFDPESSPRQQKLKLLACTLLAPGQSSKDLKEV
jgi:hypothetical protein